MQEELNAALMRQVASAGTFLPPVLVEDCDVPPPLGRRRFVDFREGYEAGPEELSEVFGRGAKAAELAGIISSTPARSGGFRPRIDREVAAELGIVGAGGGDSKLNDELFIELHYDEKRYKPWESYHAYVIPGLKRRKTVRRRAKKGGGDGAR